MAADSPRASRVLTVGEGSTLEGVADTRPRDVLGVTWEKLAVAPCDTDRQTDRPREKLSKRETKSLRRDRYQSEWR